MSKYILENSQYMAPPEILCVLQALKKFHKHVK